MSKTHSEFKEISYEIYRAATTSIYPEYVLYQHVRTEFNVSSHEIARSIRNKKLIKLIEKLSAQ